MSRQFNWSHPKQRELFLSFVDTFTRAAVSLAAELGKEQPNVDTLDVHCGSIQHDLNTLRHAYMMQLAAKPVEGK